MNDPKYETFQSWANANEILPAATQLATHLAPPVTKSLGELATQGENDPNELLCYRYLCRGGGLLLVGPTGIGKSSFALQAMILWGIGREFFGIKPVKPLKSLLIQAENDDGDLVEIRDGVIRGLQLKEEEARLAMGNVIVAKEDARTGVGFFMAAVRPLLANQRPDLLWLDPVLAYLGAESNSQKEVGGFLRNQLNPLLGEFKCAAVVVHHTNKPPAGTDKPEWAAGDFAYLGGGSSEWANWARAVLGLRSRGSHTVFELCAGKRGRRLKWLHSDGKTQVYSKIVAHAEEPGVICWREAKESEARSSVKAKHVPTKNDILQHVPTDHPISKSVLQSKAAAARISVNRINGLIAELVADGTLHEWQEKRAGTNPRKLLARFPQPGEGLMV